MERQAALLLHAAAVVAQDFAFLAQVLRVLLALVRHVQAVRLLQRSLRKTDRQTDRGAMRGAYSRAQKRRSEALVTGRPEHFLGLVWTADYICQRSHAFNSPEWKRTRKVPEPILMVGPPAAV